MSSLRLRTLLGVSLLAAALLVAAVPLSRLMLEPSFDQFELDSAQQSMERLRLLLQSEARTFQEVTRDYAHWSETVALLRGNRPHWRQKHLDDSVFTLFDFDAVLIASPDLQRSFSFVPAGGRLWADEAESNTLFKQLEQRWLDDAETRSVLTVERPRADIEFHQGEPYLVARSSVLDPADSTRTAHGLMVWLRKLDASRLAVMHRAAQLPFSLQPHLAGMPSELSIEFNGDKLSAVMPLESGHLGDGAVALVHMPRPLVEQRHAVEQTIWWMLAVAIAACALLGFGVADLLVGRRIRRLSVLIHRLRAGNVDSVLGAAPARGLLRRDEIDNLSDDVRRISREIEARLVGVREQSERDFLTGLGNRARLMNELPAALGVGPDRGRYLVLMLIDLDGFKQVNDTLGYHAGDALLREAALRIGDNALPPASAYRLGGDEFALLVPQVDSETLAEQIAVRVSMSLQTTRIVDGRHVPVSASVGIALSAYQQPLDASEMLIRADIALLDAKNSERGGIRLFSEHAHNAFRDRIELESLLRGALKEQALQAWLQPVVASGNSRVVGFEALARWHDPVRGWVEPGRFIAAAERAQLIPDVDLCVTERAIQLWLPLRSYLPRARLNVNVSAKSLLAADFLPRFAELLNRYQVPAKLLAVELTESELGISDERLEAALAELRRLQVPLIVDDFGVGASSLSRLARLRPAGVKIDGSFVRDLEGDGGRICRVVLELARELGMTVTAEFVENAYQAERLAEMGCHFQQGFRYSAALSGDRLERWVSERLRLEMPISRDPPIGAGFLS
ncbi:putative bifunctional diguanylate cyclase/phosphodiesterase [Pseudomarimonas arenosa]|uniref:EAL domain-containing protein n=1 Tax=Pseudomarimonas arenosa TaxID=2774145 RepID=A0AAW3ZLD3_9GAMM|nr:EAL domain-containing protein [Pseudomarimonas arenosa]MBD8525487.1 EAL domain-containing protein [Pseudomarimonas arenosa]